MNTSGSSTISSNNVVERKNSTEEKRSVTYSNKATSISSIQQQNETSKTLSPTEMSLHKSAISEFNEEDENPDIEAEDGGRCIVM